MVINDKALLTLMKDAYKGGGYTVAVKDDCHTIIAPLWAVEINSENLPRDVIGLLAVHMGFLPGEETAYKITKTKEGPAVQSAIYDHAITPIQALKKDVRPSMAATRVKKTGLTLDGMNVWQNNIGRDVHLFSPDLESLFDKKEGLALAGDALYAEGEISRAWVMRVKKDPEDPFMKCLSSIRWTA